MNALDTFGIQLKVPDDRLGYDSGAQIGSAKSAGVVREQTFIPPGAIKTATVVANDGTVEIPVVNTTDDAMILQKGQVVGEFAEDEIIPVKCGTL
ncbi:unnamed protein product [Heligmosomoides polygyrus]|uniref:Lipoyl-binding domain-containing protein n=1 Tax=Heligmosomoides polygyrus TaxID=6339 RepID=A0A183FZC6_HELPZ|nr:unnamed protein product [Heligmosomoides polygyrus]